MSGCLELSTFISCGSEGSPSLGTGQLNPGTKLSLPAQGKKKKGKKKGREWLLNL